MLEGEVFLVFLGFAYAIPNFLFAVILIVFFAGGRFYDIFPLRGLVSENFERYLWFC